MTQINAICSKKNVHGGRRSTGVVANNGKDALGGFSPLLPDRGRGVAQQNNYQNQSALNYTQGSRGNAGGSSNMNSKQQQF